MEYSKDLNKCPLCNNDIAISGSGIMFCPDDDCKIEVIGKLKFEKINSLEKNENKSKID